MIRPLGLPSLWRISRRETKWREKGVVRGIPEKLIFVLCWNGWFRLSGFSFTLPVLHILPVFPLIRVKSFVRKGWILRSFPMGVPINGV